MKKILIEDNIWAYQFEEENEMSLGMNVYVLLEGKKCLMIDAAYEKQMKEVLKDLNDNGIEIEAVIPSHFHPDHIGGLKLMSAPKIYGNSHAEATIKAYSSAGDVKYFLPTDKIDEETTVKFGEFQLKFMKAKGHSDCSMFISINDKYLHIGDNLMSLNNGDPVLPYVSWAGVANHIQTLEKIKSDHQWSVLLSHGFAVIEYKDALAEAKNREIYLKALLDSVNKVSAKDAVKDCDCEFKFIHWREYVL